MAKLNPNFLRLSREYLFPEIEKKVLEHKRLHPHSHPINLGVGDVALPLAPSIIHAMKEAADEMGEKVLGYGPSEGYPFLREKIVETEYEGLGISPDEIFISDGINSDICNIQDLFSDDIHVGILDPSYPVYLDTQIMRGSKHITLIPCKEENGFIPYPPNTQLDLIFLCTPNNPTGVAIPKDVLKLWVDYAKKNRSIILLDAAYEGFITEDNIPHSIFEIEGAKEVAIEFRSFSKSSGFTALRVGYATVPKEVMVHHDDIDFSLWEFWKKRQNTKTNGVSYPMQRAAHAALLPLGKIETSKQTQYYLQTAKEIRQTLESLGYTCYGGINAPYVWWKNPTENDWDLFHEILETIDLITIPGNGFGEGGQGFIRLSAFLSPLHKTQALERLSNLGALN